MLTSLILLAIIISLIIIFLWKLYNNIHYWDKKGITNIRTLNDYKNVILTIFNCVCVPDNLLKQYNAMPDKSVYGTIIFNLPMLLVKDPEILRQIMVKDFVHFTDHIEVFFPKEESDSFFSKNLFALKGERWHAMRTTLSPAFTGSKMRIMFQLIQECGEQVIKYFDKRFEQNGGNLLETDFLDTCTRYTNDVIAIVAMGLKVDSLDNPNNQFYKIGQYVQNFKISRFMLVTYFHRIAKFFDFKVMPQWIYDYFRNTIKETIETRERKSIVRPDMIQLLTETKKGLLKHDLNVEKSEEFAIIDESEFPNPSKDKFVLTDEDIVAQAFLFFVAGFGNVASTMCWASYELALNPEIQNKLFNEIKQTLEENNGKLTYDILIKMKYLDLVVTETLRKWPPVILNHRQVTKPYILKTKDGDIHLEEGMYIAIPIYSLHRDPKYYPNPEKFDPERFVDPSKINQFSYMPFGKGPRICIGSRLTLMEVKVFLVYMLLKYEFTVIDKTPIPPRLKKVAVLEPVGGFWLGVKRRN